MTCFRARARSLLAPVAFGIAACTACAGCGSDDPGNAAGAGGGASPDALRVVLGSGRAAFEPVGADGMVPLIQGIQGGFHVWTSFFAYGFDTDVLRMELATRWDMLDDSLLEMKGNVAVRPAMDASGAPALVSLGWPASIFNPACANGKRLDLTITVIEQPTGRSASDEQHWVVDVAEENRSNDCAD